MEVDGKIYFRPFQTHVIIVMDSGKCCRGLSDAVVASTDGDCVWRQAKYEK